MNPLSGKLSGSLKAFGGSLDDAAKARVGILFQNSHAQLFSLTVWDELMFGPLQMGLGVKEARERAEDILGMLGIAHLRERSPWQLSGGEMKKVALGTCLSTNPDAYLLDEPTAGLDPRSQVELVELVWRLKEAGKTVVTATHDLHIVADISERTIVLGEDHRVIAGGSTVDVLRDHGTLLRANLIHEHAHRHEDFVHEHSHQGAHDHTAGYGPARGSRVHESAHPPIIGEREETKGLDGKLRILIEHWSEHNREHANTYLEWARRADAEGRGELASILKEIAAESAKLEALFEKAKRQMS
jgi:cobalt/nickel transport system ATP-binding protein